MPQSVLGQYVLTLHEDDFLFIFWGQRHLSWGTWAETTILTAQGSMAFRLKPNVALANHSSHVE